MIRIFVDPEDLADYHQQIVGDEEMHLVAKNEDANSCVYISDDGGMPVLTVTVDRIETEVATDFEDSEDLETQADDIYERYILDFDLYNEQEIVEDDAEYSDEELKEMFGKDDEETPDEHFEYEYEMLVEQVFRHLVDENELMAFGEDSPEDYVNMLEYIKNDIHEMLMYYGLDVKRPMPV